MEVRPVTEAELSGFLEVDAVAFGIPQHARSQLAEARRFFELDRTAAVFDDGRPVATSAVLSWELTVPGPTTVPAGAVTYVAVLPTHRRRGLLTSMMRNLLLEGQTRGEPLSVLLASESSIYGRFGYGPAVTTLTVEIDCRDAVWTTEAPAPPGRFRMLAGEEPGMVLPGLFDRFRRAQPGEVSRSAGWWQAHLDDLEWRRGGASSFVHVVHEPVSGGPDGYVTYRIRSKGWKEPLPAGELEIAELVALAPAARAALWRYCLGVDLVRTVRAFSCPVDEPLRWMLTDPRRARVVSQTDWLWVRLLDVAVALAARRYAAEGQLRIELTDRFLPETAGVYELDAGPEGATCRRTGGTADLALSAADLGAAYLGGVRFSTLARAGRVEERRPRAVARADLLFASDPPPFSATEF